jgi:putative ABC transport system permease protein
VTRRTEFPFGLLMALRHLRHDRRRTVLAVAGVAFPTVLVLFQLGLLGAVRATATQVYDALEFDIALVSHDYRYLVRPGNIPRAALRQALALDGVESATPIFLGTQFWLNRETGSRRQLLVIGVDPRDVPFREPSLRQKAATLGASDRVLVDQLTRPEFGELSSGLRTELGPVTVRIADHYRMGTGFAAYGGVVTGDELFLRIRPDASSARPSIGLVRLVPSAAAESVADALEARLPPSVMVLTRSELMDAERQYWDENTSVGVIIGWGVIVALMVSGVVFYQILSLDVTNQLTKYATLGAMGFPVRDLQAVVLWQAILLCLAGFAPGVVLTLGLYRVTAAVTRLPLAMGGPGRPLAVFAFLLILSLGAAWLALGRLARADPADLF